MVLIQNMIKYQPSIPFPILRPSGSSPSARGGYRQLSPKSKPQKNLQSCVQSWLSSAAFSRRAFSCAVISPGRKRNSVHFRRSRICKNPKTLLDLCWWEVTKASLMFWWFGDACSTCYHCHFPSKVSDLKKRKFLSDKLLAKHVSQIALHHCVRWRFKHDQVLTSNWIHNLHLHPLRVLFVLRALGHKRKNTKTCQVNCLVISVLQGC